LLDRQGVALELLAVHLLNGSSGLVLIGHLDEPKASGFTGGPIPHDSDGRDLAEGPECLSDIILACVSGEVSNIDVHLAFPLQSPRFPRAFEFTPGLFGVIRRRFSCECPSTPYVYQKAGDKGINI
jgi:hypothetical protein